MKQNLKCSSLSFQSILWCTVFAFSIWYIWTWRCNKVFQANFNHPTNPANIIYSHIRSWLDVNNVNSSKSQERVTQISWIPPPIGVVKLNVDGSCCLSSGDIRVGGVLRSHQGLFLGGFFGYLGKGNVLLAELIGIHKELIEVILRNFSDIIIESDSCMVVELLTGSVFQFHPYFHLIEDNLQRG